MSVPSVLGVLVVSFRLGNLVTLLPRGVPTGDIFRVSACGGVGGFSVCLSVVF